MAIRCNNLDPDSPTRTSRLGSLYEFEGLKRVPLRKRQRGRHRRHFTGIDEHVSSATPSATPDTVEPLPFVKIDRADRCHDLLASTTAPSPAREGTVRHLPPPARPPDAASCRPTFPCAWRRPRPRTPSASAGRGELHLSMLIENDAAGRAMSSRCPSRRCSVHIGRSNGEQAASRWSAWSCDVPSEYVRRRHREAGPPRAA